jgi:hypothetical protein
LAFDRLAPLLRQALGETKTYYLLTNHTEVYGIESALPDRPEFFSAGRAFSLRAEVRWKAANDHDSRAGLTAMILTEDAELAASLEPDAACPAKSWRVARYEYDERGDRSVPPAKLWARTETRLPVEPKYPRGLFLSYTVYHDPDTHVARFTRLKAN